MQIGDVHTFLPGNSKDGTSDIDVRVIEVTLDDGTKEYLATNLFDPLITQAMFQELYFYRWPVETKYKELHWGLTPGILYFYNLIH